MTLRKAALASVIATLTAATAFADADYNDTVRDVLDANGYTNVALTELSEGDKTLIYTTATGEERSDLDAVFESIGLEQDKSAMMGDGDVFEATGTNRDGAALQVRETMMDLGYTEAQFEALSDEELAEVYTTLAGEERSSVEDVLDGIFDS